MEFDKSLNSCRLLKFGKWFLLILEYFNLHITKYRSREVKTGCCKTYTQLIKKQPLSQSSSSLLITIQRFFSLWSIFTYHNRAGNNFSSLSGHVSFQIFILVGQYIINLTGH